MTPSWRSKRRGRKHSAQHAFEKAAQEASAGKNWNGTDGIGVSVDGAAGRDVLTADRTAPSTSLGS